jgi:NADPH-dependent curcumin reductase CurA
VEISLEEAIKPRESGLQNVGEVLSREYPQKIDIAYEGVGGSLRDAVLANLSPDGQVLAVGYISEYPHTRCPHLEMRGFLLNS